MEAHLVPKRRADLVHSIAESGLLLFDRHGEQLIGLDDVGAAVWLLVDGARSTREIAAIVRDVLAVEPSRVEDAIATLLRTLASRGLIELAA